MIPDHALHLLDTATLISILFQLTDRPEATADDLALWRVAAAIVGERLSTMGPTCKPDHPFTGISVSEINYRVEVDPDPRWWPAGTWEHFRRELAAFADDTDLEAEPERFWFNVSDRASDCSGRLHDVVQAWRTALARRDQPLAPGAEEASAPKSTAAGER